MITGAMPPRPAATLYEVAHAVGVSHMTVQRALSGSPLVKEATRLRVREAADRLGYRPNLTARAMRTRSASRVGLLTSTEWRRSHLTIDLLVAMHDTLHRSGLSLSLMRLSDDELLDRDLLSQQVRAGAGDGLIVAYESHQPQELADLLEGLRVPTVWFNVKRDVDCVHADDLLTGRLAAQRLLDLGHRRLLYFCQSYDPQDPLEHYSAVDRCAGVAEACAVAGAQLMVRRNRVLPPGRSAWAASALRESQATAAVCYSGAAAWELHQAALAAGRTVPRDLSLVSCDGEWGPYQPLALAAYTPDSAAMGQHAAELLLAQLAEPGRRQAPRACPPVISPATATLAAAQ